MEQDNWENLLSNNTFTNDLYQTQKDLEKMYEN